MKNQIHILELDFLKPETLDIIPKDIDAAYFLMHAMSASSDYDVLEEALAVNFRAAVNKTTIQQVIYLSGIVNTKELSKHLQSRKWLKIC